MTQAIDKDSLPLNKPRRTPNHPTKSHVVKTKVDGKEKIIRFGEQGAETAGKPKAGESEHMKQKRASFKARHGANIAKGQSSAAYWANKVKWADGGSVDVKDATLNKIAKMLGDNGESAIEDYSQLLKAYPNAKKFLKALQSNIESHIPTTEDLQSPERMGEWSLAAALNQPTGLTFIGKNARNWDAQAAKLAEEKLNAGVDPAEVWREHLIGRMPDKTLFSEISDEPLTVRSKNFNDTSGSWGIHPQEVYGLDDIKSLLDEGISERGIHKLTGWAKHYGESLSPEGEWVPPSSNYYEEKLVEHQPLSQSYDFNNLQILGRADESPSATGYFSGENNKIGINANVNKKGFLQNYSGARSVAAHELQHAIQQKEGWPRGGSPEEMREEALAMLRRDVASGEMPSTEQAMSMLPMAQYNAYRRLTGEAQARASQDRLNMDMAQRRENYPLAGGKLSDIPLEELIYKYYEGNGPSLQEIQSRAKHYADGGSVKTKGNAMAEARSIPQNAALSKLAELLSKAKDIGNKVDLPVIGGLGDLVMGETPSEIENWSYGNYPIQTTEMGLPQIKRERKQSLADTALALGPMVKATKNLPVGLSIKAYHGSPHQFDRFDMSKIGTGEGAQAYGHGLYLAENPDTAIHYAEKLINDTDLPKGENEAENYILNKIKSYRDELGASPDKTDIYQWINSDGKLINDEYDDFNYRDVIDSLDVVYKKIPSGNIYETSIQWPDAAREAADPLGEHHLLDWDKPLSEQSENIKKIMSEYMVATPNMTGEQAWKSAINQFATPEAASKRLNEIGIPGIKYLDQGSRTGGGTSNYVMFGDEYPQIVNRAGSLDELMNRYLEKPDNYAQGGAVQYDPAKIDAIIAAIPKFSDDEIKTIMQSS